MSAGTLLIILLIVLIIASIPRWGYSRSWGGGPSGLLTLVLVIVLILFVAKVIS